MLHPIFVGFRIILPGLVFGIYGRRGSAEILGVICSKNVADLVYENPSLPDLRLAKEAWAKLRLTVQRPVEL